MACGKWPSRRHDNSGFAPSDADRGRNAGQSPGWRACCLYLKGDWSEFAHTFAYPTWPSNLN
eukprot:1823789-Alexandrium_andersonii.AAC.1